MLDLLFINVPEAIYFSSFFILIKGLNEHRAKLTLIMIIEYLTLKMILPFDLKFQFIFIFVTYMTLKFIYKNKVQITDIFLFVLASLNLMIVSAVVYLVMIYTFKNLYIGNLIAKLLYFLTMYIFKDKIKLIYQSINKNWNRRPGAKIKSLTVRNICLILFNTMLFLLGIGIIYVIS